MESFPVEMIYQLMETPSFCCPKLVLKLKVDISRLTNQTTGRRSRKESLEDGKRYKRKPERVNGGIMVRMVKRTIIVRTCRYRPSARIRDSLDSYFLNDGCMEADTAMIETSDGNIANLEKPEITPAEMSGRGPGTVRDPAPEVGSISALLNKRADIAERSP